MVAERRRNGMKIRNVLEKLRHMVTLKTYLRNPNCTVKTRLVSLLH